MSRTTKTERLLNLVAYLLKARRPVPWKNIVGKVVGYDDDDVQPKSLERRFERDKQSLKQMGIPIVYHPPDAGQLEGYVVPRDAVFMRPMQLAPHESMLLHVIGEAALAEDTDDALRKDLVSALRKVRFDDPEAFEDPPEEGEPTYRPSVEFGDQGEALSHFASLSEALYAHERVRFSYHGVQHAEPETREVDPWGLGFHQGSWYLVGWDHLREGKRCFKVSRIVDSVETTGDEVDHAPPDDFDVAGEVGRPAWEMGDEPATEVTVRLSSDLAWRVAEEAPRAREVERQEDGSAIVRIEIQSVRGFLRWAMRRLRHVEVLDPPEVVEAFRREMEELLAVYREPAPGTPETTDEHVSAGRGGTS